MKQARGWGVRRTVEKAASAGSSKSRDGGGTSHAWPTVIGAVMGAPVRSTSDWPSSGTNASR